MESNPDPRLFTFLSNFSALDLSSAVFESLIQRKRIRPVSLLYDWLHFLTFNRDLDLVWIPHRRAFFEASKNMPHNEYSLHDIMYITQPTRNIMSILGIWPAINKKKTLCERVYKFLLITISYTLLICNLIPIFLYWMMQGDTRTRIQMAPFLVYDAMTVSQYSIFIFRDDQIRQCLKHVQEDWENILSADVRTLMLKFARITKRIIIVSASFMFSGAILIRTILPLLQGDIITEQNVTIRPLVCPSYLVFIDVQATPIYEIYFTIQFLSGLIIASIATGACGLTAIFVIHASGQLRILRNLMTNLVEEESQREYEVNKKLADIVEHQMRVRGFLRMVQHTLQQIFLMGMTVNTLTLCILMYFIIIEWQNSNTTAIYIYILCVGDVGVHIFMYCYTGEQLTKQAIKTAGAYFNMLRNVID